MVDDKATVEFLLQQLLDIARAQDRKLDLLDEGMRRVELELAELKGRVSEMSARMPVLIGTYQPPAQPPSRVIPGE